METGWATVAIMNVPLMGLLFVDVLNTNSLKSLLN